MTMWNLAGAWLPLAYLLMTPVINIADLVLNSTVGGDDIRTKMAACHDAVCMS